MARKSLKGNVWEREFCKLLSVWWSNGRREDLFWRTAVSGARATVRFGKDTANSHGDIGAMDPIAVPLLKLFTFELKRGYSDSTLFDIIDRPSRVGKPVEQLYESWIRKTNKSHLLADSYSWAIVARRDKRTPVIILDYDLVCDLRDWGAFFKGLPTPHMLLKFKLHKHRDLQIICITLTDFLEGVLPEHVMHYIKRQEEGPSYVRV